MQPGIDIRDLSVDFPLYHGSSRSIKKIMLAAATGRFGKDTQRRVVVQALRDINLTLRSGDRLGLIGHNGAGKTTLLRVLAGIYEPTCGHVSVVGNVHTLIDPNMGMNPELTGRENIRLRGLYHGLSAPALRNLQDDVATFSELGHFLDIPVRTYSSGMLIRLGFALATSIPPEILLMDEWILAGDADFLARAQARLEGLVKTADILVLSSHMLPIIETWTTRSLWMEGGRVQMDGPSADVVRAYKGNHL